MPRPIDPQALKAWLNWDEEQRYEFEERAAIIEFDGNTHRLVAEREALEAMGKLTKGQ